MSEQQIITCDNCETDLSGGMSTGLIVYPLQPLSVRLMRGPYHFCNYNCLSDWTISDRSNEARELHDTAVSDRTKSAEWAVTDDE